MRRLFIAVGSLFLASILSFLLADAAPGDPIEMQIQRDGLGNREAVERIKKELGLDAPPWKRYLAWWGDVLQGDFGTSIHTGRPVLKDLLSHLWPTLQLAVTSILIATAGGITGGVLIARYRKKWFAPALHLFSTLGLSLPGYLHGLIFIFLGAVFLKLLPTSGYGGLTHFILPSLSLVVGLFCYFFLFTYGKACEFSEKEFVKCARAKGLPERTIWFKHIFKNALLPIISFWGGIFGNLIAGSVVIETLFAWPGIGKMAIDAVFNRDYPVIQGYIFVVTALVVSINFIVDLLSRWVDPLFAEVKNPT